MNENIRSLFVSYTRMLKWTYSYVSYKKDKIEEGEICQVKDKKCVWILPEAPKEETVQKEEIVENQNDIQVKWQFA